MAVVDIAGSINNLSSIDLANSNPAQNVTNGGKLRFVRDTVEVAAGNDDGSKFRLARIPANAVIESMTVEHDAITGGTDYDLGIYDAPEVNSGAVIDADLFAASSDLSSAGSVDGLAATDIADKAKKVWELAGLTERPNKFFDIALTGNTVGTAAGTITLTVVYSID